MTHPSDPRFQDITGQIFTRWTVLRYAGCRGRFHYWACRCACGTVRDVAVSSLKQGTSRSFGCLMVETSSRIRLKNIEAFTGARRTHGMTNTPTFMSWNMMLQRCYNPRRSNYEFYGGRGIVVCDRWRHSFENFLEDMGIRPDGMTLDRKDSNKNYTKSNCRWATKIQQAGNRRKRGPNKNPYTRS